MKPRALLFAALAVTLFACLPAAASADWTTYRGDAARSGIDTSSTGSLPFAAAWSSPNLGGDIWGQPLVHDGLVIVGTESDEVVALNESTGQVVWQASTGTPVPSSKLPCGDISPTVGITSTPVIDPANNEVFAVADTLSGSTIEHKLYAFNASTGAAVAGFPVDVEPPGDDAAAQLQRAALALDNGEIVIGYGGNDGDCSTYHGWLVSVSESGGSEHTFEVDSGAGHDQGAIWGSGNGPAVDASGDIWAATGNGNSGSDYDDQESVLKLDSSLNLLDYWAPSDWQSLDSSDLDLGSSEPLLLPDNLVFEIGKQGIGYLLNAANLGHEGAKPAYQAQVCAGSWGGAIYENGVIYATCSDGLRALSLDASAPSFSAVPGWHVTSAIAGPPTIAGNLIWATDAGTNDGSTLYGLNLQTGQAVVKQSIPSTVHFASPSASDGKLFLATDHTVEAYTIANAVAPGTSAPVPSPNRCVLTLNAHRIKAHHPRRRKHEKHAPAPYGTVALVANCSQATNIALSGTITEQLGKNRKHHRAKTRSFHLKTIHTTLPVGLNRTLELRLPDKVLTALAHATKRSGMFTLTAPGVRVVIRKTGLRL
ncbi:MAG TPA: PQQ-binding-like beta-propeller repeat protein [Solirubrobacteraceae bacterium]|nr:PQQ-binding-like beta-propeller repeat protein [Solirubrobacteraceae bacterium]